MVVKTLLTALVLTASIAGAFTVEEGAPLARRQRKPRGSVESLRRPAVSTALPRSSVATAPAIPQTRPRGGRYWSVGLASFQDGFTLTLPDGRQFPASTATVGLCAGGGVAFPVSGRWLVDAGGCLLGALGDAGFNSTGTTTTVSYSNRNEKVFGLIGRIGLFWSTVGDEVRIGFSVPLVVKSSPWTLPGTGYSKSGDGPLSFGIAFEAPLRRGNLTLRPRMGFLEALSQFYWAFDCAVAL